MEQARILIVGMGPAGLAASIFLRQQGFPVIVIDRLPHPKLKIGESLPPNAQSLLEQLGIWEAFQQSIPLKCYSNKSVWGSERLQFHDFIQQAPGHGWHIDRLGFEQLLFERAEQLGVALHWATTMDQVQRVADHWEVTLKTKGDSSKQHFSFLVDASGRNSWLARRLGFERLYEDRQLALVAFLQSQNQELEDHSSLLETHPDGWWYSAKIPDQKLATAFFCQADTQQKSKWTQADGWWALAQTSPHTFDRLQSADFKLLAPPRIVSADSGILEQLYGPGWLAVGDAAMTYDPIASHGLMMAMLSGRDAAEAIATYFAEQAQALAHYQDRLLSAYQQYQQQRKGFYLSETRFPSSFYWKERQRSR